MKTLVIVESPAKAATIKKILGKNDKVIASVGHIRDLPKSKLGVDIENDFAPQYITIRGKAPIANEIKKEAAKVDRVLLATDPDREGEAISWHLAHILGLEEGADNRIEFNEITKEAIKEAIKHPRKINQNTVDAQQGRRVLDRLVGYKIGPLLWKKIRGGLSAGRVQSVAVKMICDREDEIKAFVPEEYWSLEAFFKDSSYEFSANFIGIKNQKGKTEKLTPKNEEEVDNIVASLKKNQYIIEGIEIKKKKRHPSAPFITSTLQQEASKRLNYSSKKTMAVAQSLYEGVDLGKKGTVGLITYMRTDSTRISEQALNKTREFIKDEYGKQYSQGKRQYGKGKNAQDAHECIRPTNILLTPEVVKDNVTKDEFRLYQLIWTRFIASQMTSATFETHAIQIINNDYIFRATGQKLLFDGFLKIYQFDKAEKNTMLPSFNEGDIVNLKELRKEQHFTQPPARYTESSLIKTMEELGIGRPSTYAPTINTILSRRYVILEKKSFRPTELGETVNEVLVEFFPSIVDETFTADMESRLDKIEDGEVSWQKVVGDFYDPFRMQLDKANKQLEAIEMEPEVSDEICEKCGRQMVYKIGRYGKFLACPGYPECKNTKPIIKTIGVKCPKCNDGEIVVRRGKKNRKIFYGCSNYPKCEFVLWDKPIDKKCPECGEILVSRQKNKNEIIACSNPDCKYESKE